jgi:acyl-homoserine lactone synthase
MAIIERGAGGSGTDTVLKSMFEARKRVFVDLLHWNVPVLDGRFEVDQFDDPHATYIILADPSGNHLGSARLLETTRPHILGNLFPTLCASAVPIGAGVLEITRFCLDRRLGASGRRKVRNRLVSALVSHALHSGIATYTGVAEMGWLQQILAFGWDCRPLGIPRPIDGRMLGALAISITPDTPALLDRNGIWHEEELVAAALPEAA